MVINAVLCGDMKYDYVVSLYFQIFVFSAA